MDDKSERIQRYIGSRRVCVCAGRGTQRRSMFHVATVSHQQLLLQQNRGLCFPLIAMYITAGRLFVPQLLNTD